MAGTPRRSPMRWPWATTDAVVSVAVPAHGGGDGWIAPRRGRHPGWAPAARAAWWPVLSGGVGGVFEARDEAQCGVEVGVGRGWCVSASTVSCQVSAPTVAART